MRSLNSDKQIAHEQERMVNTAKSWRADTIKRLGITHEELEAVVLRGWGGDLIDEVTAAEVDRLQGTPTDLEIAETITAEIPLSTAFRYWSSPYHPRSLPLHQLSIHQSPS